MITVASITVHRGDEQEMEPAIDWAAYLRERRRALLQEVNAIEAILKEDPTVRALCPTCKTRWNKRAG